MSRSSLPLQIRAIPVLNTSPGQWTCRRCLATQSNSIRSAASSDVPNYDPTLPASKRIGPDGQPYRLKKSDFFLKKPLPQARIPIAYLQHSTSEILHESEKAQREETVKHKRYVGAVVTSGLMDKTVKVRMAGQAWNKRLGKMFHDHTDYLVHDPNNSLVTGDVVELHRLRVSKHVRHVVGSIVSPFGTPIESRPPIPTPDERLAAYKEKRFAKLQRRELRVRAANGDAAAAGQLTSIGLDPGAGTERAAGGSDAKKAISGQKGQKLSTGVLPGGEYQVGKISERARYNKGKAMKLEKKVEEHLLEAQNIADALEMESDSHADPKSKQ